MQPVVCLVGPRCVGKTTVGAALARELGWPFSDLDDELAELWARETGAAEAPHAGELLAELGEEAFRDLEARALAALLDAGGPRLLATGGGCVERAENRARLAAVPCLWMSADPGLLQHRLAADAAPRPALGGPDPVAELPDLIARRAPLYAEVAGAAVDLGDAPVEAWVARLAERLA